jgi:hypothetical protein
METNLGEHCSLFEVEPNNGNIEPLSHLNNNNNNGNTIKDVELEAVSLWDLSQSELISKVKFIHKI